MLVVSSWLMERILAGSTCAPSLSLRSNGSRYYEPSVPRIWPACVVHRFHLKLSCVEASFHNKKWYHSPIASNTSHATYGSIMPYGICFLIVNSYTCTSSLSTHPILTCHALHTHALYMPFIYHAYINIHYHIKTLQEKRSASIEYKNGTRVLTVSPYRQTCLCTEEMVEKGQCYWQQNWCQKDLQQPKASIVVGCK